MDCKRALDEAKGDFAKAKTLIKERGLAKAKEKADREANEGLVEAYVHAGGRIGALVELSSETDFVARNPEFKELAREIAMQVAAMDPTDVDQLLGQAYIRDASKTIGELVTSIAATTGENVRVKRFKRFELGQSNGEPT
jgi:elongation factor Ts